MVLSACHHESGFFVRSVTRPNISVSHQGLFSITLLANHVVE